MTPIADSTVLVDWLRGSRDAHGLLRSAAARDEIVLGSVVSRAEILAGVRPAESQRVGALLRSLEWVPVTAEIADLAGEYAREHRRANVGIGIADYIIAATATVAAAKLWTGNVRHFPMFPGLVAPY